VTTLLYLVAIVILAYYFLFSRTGSLLITTAVLIVPWAVVVAVIEYRRHRLAITLQRNLAVNGRPVPEVPTFVDIQFLRWKRNYSVTTDELQASAPKS
jgi:hypothetical protein